MKQHRSSLEPELEPESKPEPLSQPPPHETGIKSEPTWSLNPTVFHPTPRLESLSYPPTPEINRPRVASQASMRQPQRETIITNTSEGLSPRSSPPPRVPRMKSRSSTQSAMRSSRRTHTRTTSRVSFDTSGRIPKTKKRTGWRDPASLEDLFG